MDSICLPNDSYLYLLIYLIHCWIVGTVLMATNKNQPTN